MKKSISFIFILFLFVVSAFKLQQKSYFIQPKNWPLPLYDFSKNPLSKEKIDLGRALFYEPLLSRDNTISCASCHSSFTAFAHVDHALSHGIENKIGNRNAPALMNLAWSSSFMWDGAINHLDMQALAPISNPLEMDEKIEQVVLKLQKTKNYPPRFYAAFRDSTISGEHCLKAISQFMLSIESFNSRYDSVMRKEAKFTEQEKNGYRLFQKNCATCHTEPLFTNYKFENNGLALDTNLNDWGRIKISHLPQDSLKFKVPTLRNIEFSYPYMHDGRFKKLNEVLNHYTNGIVKSSTLSPILNQKIVLSSNEKVDVIAFLLSLSDRSYLFNSAYRYPKVE